MKRILRIAICLSLLSINVSAQTWSALGVGFSGGSPATSVNTLCVYQSQLCAGGSFNTGNSNTSYVQSWDGTAWDNGSPVILGLGSIAGTPYILCVYNDSIFIGGQLSDTQYNTRNGIAKSVLNVRWKAVGTGNGINGQVYALAVYNGELYAAGEFNTAGTISANHIARWNGVTWDSVGYGLGNTVYSLAVYNNELYAGGIFTNGIYKWNGTTWAMVGSGVPTTSSNGVFALDSCFGKLYVGGQFTTAGGISASNIASWDGTTWSTVGLGTDQKVNTLCQYNGQLYVGGYFSVAGGNSANHIASWNGSAWSSLTTGTNDIVYSLCQFNTELAVGGQFTTAGGISANAIAKWYSPAATGVSEPEIVNFVKVYPNPTTDNLSINLSGKIASSIGIFNIVGQRIIEQAYMPSIDISSLPSGFYFLNLFDKEGKSIANTQFIKQ
jgi:hypothetical protein